MDSDRAIERAIETVARLYERSVLSHSPLHLAACGGCGGPSFQQPCPLCNFYPMGSDKGQWHPRTASRQFFCDRVAASASDGAGNLATWVLFASRKTVAYAQSYAFRQRLDGALAEAAHLEMPDPGLIHDRVAGDGTSGLVDWVEDAGVVAIVGSWPPRFETPRARALGLTADDSYDDVVREYRDRHT